MSTIGTFLQRIQSLYSKGVESDDSRLTRRHKYSALKSARSTLIFNKVNKNQFINHWNYQVLPCVEMIRVPSHECPCLPPIGCEMLRTKFKLPKPISNISKHLIASVSSIDGEVIFHETTFSAKKYKKGNKYTADKPDYFIKDEYLYITVQNNIKAITIMGLFNDPFEVAIFPNLCKESSNITICPVNPMDIEFNIDEDLETVLIEMALKELMIMFTKEDRQDFTNNSRDDAQ